mgnify:CR=1 FL=1
MINKSLKHNSFIHCLSMPFRMTYKSLSPVGYVKKEYRYITGHKLNLDNPVRYTEKLQYLRLFYFPKNNEVIRCASKVGIKEFLKDKNHTENIVPTIGIFDNFDDINFEKLPDAFVMKCSHGCAFNYLCYDKKNLDINKLRKMFNKWLKTDYGKKTVEPHYSKIKPQIIIEKLMLENDHLPTEYKIHIFNGKAKYLYVVTGRDGKLHYNNYYVDWTDFDRAQFNNWTKLDSDIKKPANLQEMIHICEDLAKDFPFCRVDLYSIDGHIYVSEMTFTPAKGTLTFKDDKADFEIGDWLTISK